MQAPAQIQLLSLLPAQRWSLRLALIAVLPTDPGRQALTVEPHILRIARWKLYCQACICCTAKSPPSRSQLPAEANLQGS
mmetsp:Transcript_76922/g.124454  ORF Transcript_76922/g.124454 Transcript_76922/m.124454 type:complete len:80 (+) Transcript_76922:26-265(+)